MPDGYRRGGQYQRNGRTFTRRGTSIRPPVGKRGLICVGIIAVASTAVGGSAIAAHPFLLVGVLAGITAVFVFGNPTGRRAVKRGARKVWRKIKHTRHRPVQRTRPTPASTRPQPDLFGSRPRGGSSRLLS